MTPIKEKEDTAFLVGLAEVQTASAVTGIDAFFRFVPIGVYIILIVILIFYRLDREFPAIQKELESRRASKTK